MASSYAIFLDFDGTVADTKTPCPGGVGIEGASQQAIRRAVGLAGSDTFTRQGGLRNRAPRELVHDIVGEHPRLVLEALSRSEKILYERKIDRPWETVDVITEAFVAEKLAILVPQIGTPLAKGGTWPRPIERYREYAIAVAELQCAGGMSGEFRLRTGIVSSGHQEFIRQAFNQWEVPEPDILVTEDEVRHLPYRLDPEQSAKPAPLQLLLAERELLERDGLDGFSNLSEVLEARQRILYIGDDPVRDRGMAERGMVHFRLFDPTGNEPGGFADWRELAEELAANTEKLREGRPWDEILPIETFENFREDESPEIELIGRRSR